MSDPIRVRIIGEKDQVRQLLWILQEHTRVLNTQINLSESRGVPGAHKTYLRVQLPDPA